MPVDKKKNTQKVAPPEDDLELHDTDIEALPSFAAVELDGLKVHIAIPILSYQGKRYSAEALTDKENEKVLLALWEHAWIGEDDTRRSEDEFERNGIFRIEY